MKPSSMGVPPMKGRGIMRWGPRAQSQGHPGPAFTGERGSPNAPFRVWGPQTPVIHMGKGSPNAIHRVWGPKMPMLRERSECL